MRSFGLLIKGKNGEVQGFMQWRRRKRMKTNGRFDVWSKPRGCRRARARARGKTGERRIRGSRIGVSEEKVCQKEQEGDLWGLPKWLLSQ